MVKPGLKPKLSLSDFRKFIICYLLIAITPILFPSCELEPNPTGNKVEAQLMDIYGLPIAGYGYIGMSIGGYAIASPDNNGYCRFENVMNPYNLEIFYGSSIFTFKNIDIPNPKVSLSLYNDIHNTCWLTVKFPAIGEQNLGILKFISKENFIHNYDYIDESDSIHTLSLKLPSNKTSIDGRLIFMQCKVHFDPNFYVTSYLNFGFKDISANVSSNDTVLFTREDIQFVPGDTTAVINDIYQQQVRYFGQKAYLSFPGYNSNSDIGIGSYYLQNQIQQVEPAHLSIPYSIKIISSNDCWWSTIPIPCNPKITYLQPGENSTIEHKELHLLNPQNLGEGINTNTLLEAEDDGEKGIYVFYVNKDSLSPSIYAITDKSKIRLGEVQTNDYKISPNTVYSWRSCKITSFNSIDEFLSSPYGLQEDFNTVETSDIWYFRTAP